MGMWEASRPARLAAVAVVSLTLVACSIQGSTSGGQTGKVRATPTPLYQADTVFNRMTDEQRVGQLFMVGLSNSEADRETVVDAIAAQHVGSVMLCGSGWNGAEVARSTTSMHQAVATQAATAGVRLYIAGDQEGGQRGVYQ